METSKTTRIIFNIVYIIGVIIILSLITFGLFNLNNVIYPDVMIPMTGKELAFIWLSLGAIPMFLTSMAVYKFSKIKNSIQQKRNLILIFLPAFICCGCLLFVIGVIIVGMLNSLVFSH